MTDLMTPQRVPRNLQLVNPPQVTALSWCIMSSVGDDLASKQPLLKLEIASLTKIMTAYTAIRLVEELSLDLSELIEVPLIATWVGGTSAFLKKGDSLTLVDLLYALMLPSGNDAAMTIATYFGKQLKLKKKRTPNHVICDTVQGFYDDKILDKISRFVKQMNDNASKLGMKDTQFSNPHGLSSKANKSTASDLCKLSQAYLRNDILREICNTKAYQTKNYNWINTNQLLNDAGYHGIKTGITPNAGACLSVVHESRLGSIIVVLIGSKTPKSRFEETDKLVCWVNKQYQLNVKPIIVPPRSAQSKTRSFIIKKQN